MSFTRSSASAAVEIDAACATMQRLRELMSDAPAGREPSRPLAQLPALMSDWEDAVVLCDDAAQIRLVNDAASRITGYSARELAGITIWDITHGASQHDFEVLWRAFLRAGRQLGAYTLRRRDGQALEVAYCAEARVVGDLHASVLRLFSPPPQP